MEWDPVLLRPMFWAGSYLELCMGEIPEYEHYWYTLHIYIYAYIQLYDILLIYVCIYTAYIQYIVTHDNRIYNYIIISSSHLSRGQGVASAKDIATLRFQDIAGGEEETDEPWQSLVR